MMPPQPSGKRPQFAGDPPTQLLPPVALQNRAEATQPVWDGRDRAAEEWRQHVEATLAEAWRPLDPETERRLLDAWQAECRKTGAANWMLDRAALTAPYRLGYGFGPRRDDPTAVIPVTPAQPSAEWDKKPPQIPCGKKIQAMGLLFGAGVLAGVALGFVAAVVLFALAVS